MKLRSLTHSLSAALAILLTLLPAAVAPTMAGAPSREDKAEFSAVRLLNGGEEQGIWQSGIRIALQPGWKTYWRVPGESGVPPQFDWSHSGNAADVSVEMPVPVRFSDGNGDGIGYKGEVVFPVKVKPADPARPVKLDLKMFYAVCNDICVPVQAELALELSAATASASDRFLLVLAGNALPVTDAGQLVQVKAVKLVDAGGEAALDVSLSGKMDPAAVEIFAEAEGKSAYFRKPELVSQSDGEATYRLYIDSLPDPESLRGETVRLTIAAGGTNIAHDALVQ